MKRILSILTIGALLIFLLIPVKAISANLKIINLEVDRSRISENESVMLTYWLNPEGVIHTCFNMGIYVNKENRQELVRSWGLPSNLCDELKQSRTISQTWKVDIPDWGAGIYSIEIYADVDNFLNERNRADNRMGKTVLVEEDLTQLPDLYVSEYTLSPLEPRQGQPVNIQISVYNQGAEQTGPYGVEWWASDDQQKPDCTWAVDNTQANGGSVLTCTYEGYPYWDRGIKTKVVADSRNHVRERNESNNILTKEIQVHRAAPPPPVSVTRTPPPPSPPVSVIRRGTISGVVFGAEIGCYIHLYGPNNLSVQRDFLFIRRPGNYSFTDLPDGRYRINVSIAGDAYVGAYPPSRTVECRGGRISNINFELR